MQFSVDTADTAEIKSRAASGLLDGVTTDPSLVAGTGKEFTGMIPDIRDRVPGPVSAEGLAAFLAEWGKTGRTIA